LIAEAILSAVGLEEPAIVLLYLLFGGIIIFARFTDKVSDYLDAL
jgi:hypothetical protein